MQDHDPDLDLVKEACKAELGRGRQEELPLSNDAKRPTYQPRGSGAAHIPEARKDRLENKWSIRIVDEESLQMEGLEIGNSRPWAQFTNQYMARHAVSSAPPRIAMAASQARPSTVSKTPSSIKPAAHVTAPPARPLAPVSTQKMAPRNVSQVVAGPQAQAARTNPPVKSVSQPKPSPSIPEQAILSQGECEIVNESDNSSAPAKFIAKVHVQKNEGTLVLIPSGKAELAYNVLDLGTAAIQGPFCIIFSARGERLHKVKLRTAAAADSFQYLLKCLVESAQRYGGQRPVSPKPTPALAAQKQQDTRLQSPSQPTLAAPGDAPKTTNGNASSAVQMPDSIDAPLQPESQASLLNVEDDSHPQPSLTIEAAADHMQHIVQQILSEITATGVQVPEQGVDVIESTAIANWMAQGFMQTETESAELKEELVDLLRLLVRIKRKVQHRHGGNADSKSVPISSATLQDLQEIVEKPSKRIKYTPADIKQLEGHAVSREDNIKASGLREIQKGFSSTADARKKAHRSSPPTADTPKKMAVPSMAEHRAYSAQTASTKTSDSGSKTTVELTSSAPKAANGVQTSGTKTSGGLATSRWATSDGFEKHDIFTDIGSLGWSTSTATGAAETKPAVPHPSVTVPTANGQKPKPQGLSSSRWAN
ncbi:hypothetical protein CCMA1212_001170 [Trichoderma ghanense]|uniref:Uncharacterized protein n=1 Tax=Trichoderma ghanense TaxID=65468 RepID=A0ABY2HIA7_9HYPO